jgi:putative DNA primase/helicase
MTNTSNRPPRPEALTVQPDNIPVELRVLPQWVTWKYEYQPERNPTKPWTSFETALQHVGRFDGLGFTPTDQDPYTFIDLDECRDPLTGGIAAWAQRFVDILDSYCEVSPSGTGLRIIVKGKLPPAGRKKGNVEMYQTGHYLTVTGHHLEGTPREIQERQAQIDAVHSDVFRPQSQPLPNSNSKSSPEYASSGLSDGEVLSKACSARNGEKIYRLYHLGDTSDYGGDDSAADLALCDLLVFYTGPDEAQLDRIFRGSRLFRPEKWDKRHHSDGRTYGQMTIGRALERTTEFYQPSRSDTNGHNNGFSGFSGSYIYREPEKMTKEIGPDFSSPAWSICSRRNRKQ